MAPLVVLTDLDGTLLDSYTYSFEAAHEALARLRYLGVPLVLASSKTRAEMEPIRALLNNGDPFIVENGGGLFVPTGYFSFPLAGARVCGPYHVLEWGTPLEKVREALLAIDRALGHRLRGFGDMTAEEVAERMGLPLQEAAWAKQREYDEPFVIEGPASLADEIRRLAESRGLRCTSGGRVHHLMGPSDKGIACRYLIDCYRRLFARESEPVVTVGLGDSLNDLPMLAVVDRPILVPKPDGTYDPRIDLPHLVRAPGIGPIGWNRAVLALLAGSPS